MADLPYQLIYAVMGEIEYEGYATIMAFEARRDAARLANRANAYQKLRPPLPKEAPETPESKVSFDKQWRAFERWARRHPAGKAGADYHSYSVERMKLYPPTAKGASNA